jgi:signal transduction histidine kinase
MTARRWFARIVLVTVPAAGVVVGLTTVRFARRADTASLAGRDALADILLLAVGWALIIAGLVLIRRAADRTAGMLLTAAGFAWFIADWDNQFADSPILFTAGLIGAAVCPVLVGHSVLRYHSGPIDRLGRLGLLLGYTGTVLIGGLLPTMFFDPIAQGCSSCATNVLAVQSIPSMVAWLGRAAVLLGPMWCWLLAAAIGRQLIGASPAGRRRDGPVLVPGIGYLVAVAGTYLLAIPASFVPTTPATRLLWLVQGGCLLLLAAGTGWPSVQRRLTRARVARLVVDIAAVPPVGGLSSMLARSLRDPSFLVLYPTGDHSMVDAGGHPSAPGERQTVTRVVRSGDTVAVLAHRPRLFDDPVLAAEITTAARLALDNERLQALTRARLTDLQASRARIVRTGDAERRRLERDLHDGAQQHLVSLSLALSLAAIRASEPAVAARLNGARSEVAIALGELRSLARGIYPRELADEGLGAALQTLAEGSAAPVTIDRVPSRRFPHEVEDAAYQLLSRLIRGSSGGPARICASGDDDQLRIEVTLERAPAGLAALEDRVGAIGGELRLEHSAAGVIVQAVLPCGW